MISEFLSLLSFAFGVTGPIFVLVFLGIVLKRLKLIDSTFMDSASKLVFNVALPTMLFVSVVKTDIRTVFNGSYLMTILVGTLITFVLLSLLAKWVVKNPRDRGVFVQGAFRSNLAIIGLAFCLNAYGEAGLAMASIIISVITVAYNILSIYTLSASLKQGRLDPGGMAIDIAKNPLIIGILAGVVVNLAEIPVPNFLMTSGEYIAYMTLPLALICIGGTLSLAEFKSTSSESLIAVLAKLVFVPAVIVYMAYLYGFGKMELGILFLMVGSPAAAVSYVMVQAMGGNSKLAANIVVIGTLASLFTVSFGLVLLKQLGVV